MTQSQPFIRARRVTKVFTVGGEPTVILKGITVDIYRGEFTAIMGPSGSGKSTLMYLLGGLDRPTDGEIEVAGQPLGALNSDDLAQFRREMNGFIFQSFYLVPTLTALENVALPGVFARIARPQREERAARLLRSLNMGERLHYRPSQLSGGQQQRVAIARALFNNPPILMGDEPTGALDSKTGETVLTLLRHLTDRFGKTVIIVTHDARIAQQADRVLQIQDGQIVQDERPERIAS